MSNVTQSGPKGYEYQYVVSLLIALQQLETNDIELYIEAVGIEDAFLRINSNGNIQNIEIQVKSEQNQLTIKTLTEWLYHFEAKGSNENLLKKVIGGSIALFVTQSRCSDNTVQFKKNISDIEVHSKLSISTRHSWTKEFLQHLKENEFAKKKTPLAIDRNQLCQTQKSYFSSNKIFNDTFQNVIIWEEVSHQKLNYEIEQILNQKFNIPQLQNAKIRRELEEVIEKKGRDLQQDVIPFIRQIIQKNQPERPQLNKQHQYLSRLEEQDLIEKLSRDNVLLLTGRSFCGKSELAKKIAIHFFDKGFTNYEIDKDVKYIKRFFGQNEDAKIAILEDPWGHIKVENKGPIKRDIEELISNLPNHHKLIITSRIEIIEQVFDNKLQIKGYDWINLLIQDKKQLVTYWQYFANQKNLSQTVTDLVIQNLNKSNDSDILQIGELENLSNQENLEGKTFEELVHLARQDYDEIAKKLLEEYQQAADLLSILAFCSNTIQSVSFTDLAYILLGNDKYYSISNKRGFSFVGDKEDELVFKYAEKHTLSEKHEELVEYLEDKGFITSDSNGIRFTHPNYYEAGRYLFSTKTKDFQYYKRALACWNSSTTYLAATQLDVFISNIKPRFVSELIDISFWLYRSIFPETKDVSLIFRINNIDKLNQMQNEIILEDIKHDKNRITDLKWFGDMCYISNEFSLDALVSQTDNYNYDYPSIFEKLETMNSLHSKEIVSLLLSDYYNNNITSQTTKTLLTNRYVFIRILAIDLYLSRIVRPEDEKIINLMFLDSHPSVFHAIVYNFFLNWNSYPKNLRGILSNKIIENFQNKINVIRSIRLITHFIYDDCYERNFYNKLEDKLDLWNIWSNIFITTSIHIYGQNINKGALEEIISSALKCLETNQSNLVVNAWFDIEKCHIKGMDFYYCKEVLNNLFVLTGKRWDIRKEVLSNIIKFKNTTFIVTLIRYLTEWKDELNEKEINSIIDITTQSRKDNFWVKASLIYFYPSTKVFKPIFKVDDYLSNTPEYIVKNTSKQLLKKCILLFYGSDPFYDLSCGYKNSGLWIPIIKYILENQQDALFKICLNNFLKTLINGRNLTENDLDIWNTICKKHPHTEYLVEILMYWTGRITFTIPNTKKLWEILIESNKTNERETQLIKLIVLNFELLRNFPYENYKFLGDKILRKIFHEKLKNNNYQFLTDEAAKNKLKLNSYEELENWIT